MYTTWLRSPWSRPTAPCGTRLSPSPASRWRKCCPASLWSERSRRSSVPAWRTWAKARERTGLAGHSSSVTGYWLCSIHPNPINLSILDSVLFNNHQVFQSKGQWFVLVFFFFLFPSPSCFPPVGWGCVFPLTAFVKPLSLKRLSWKVRMVFLSHHCWTVTALLGCSLMLTRGGQCSGQ